MYLWNNQTIPWFLDASQFSQFHKKVASNLIPFLDSTDTLCDIGCGLGQLDLELASYVSQITAVDICQEAIDTLKNNCILHNISNIKAICDDADQINNHYDTILMSFYGRTVDSFHHYLTQCNQLIYIVNTTSEGQLYPKNHFTRTRRTISMVQNDLEQHNYIYQLVDKKLDFGQPFRTKQDAFSFVQTYAPNAIESEITNFLIEYLQPADDDIFPYYLANRKEIGIFVIESN